MLLNDVFLLGPRALHTEGCLGAKCLFRTPFMRKHLGFDAYPVTGVQGIAPSCTPYSDAMPRGRKSAMVLALSPVPVALLSPPSREVCSYRVGFSPEAPLILALECTDGLAAIASSSGKLLPKTVATTL